MSSVIQIVLMILNLLYFVVIVHVIMSWLINFQVLNLRQPLVYQIWDGLHRFLDPIYSRVRRVLPSTGTLDLAPLVVLLAIWATKIVIANNMPAAYY